MGAALVRGVQQHNVMACVKHFALNSIERSRYKVDVRADERTLREVYLPHFKRCIDEGAASVMGAYNRFRGEFCCQNRTLLTQILRDEWGFDGFTSSDWVQGVRDTVLAAEAGMDIEMPWPKFYGRRLLRAVRDGKVQSETIDQAASRILRKTVEFVTAQDPESYDSSVVNCPDHRELALEAALKSAVLLKNENATLPFSLRDVKRLAVIGRLSSVENTGDIGSSRVVPRYTVTPWQGLSDYLSHQTEVVHSDGSSLEESCRVAAGADAVVLVVGYDYRDEGEYIGGWFPNGNDRDSLHLHRDEEELITAVAQCSRRCVVVLVGGSAIVMEPWLHLVPAVLVTWYSGQEGGTALARLLFGDANPSGRLPFTVPKDPRDLPFFDADSDSINYGFYHGYTLFDAKAIEPAFAFGHGLSYTTFVYSALRLDRQTIGPQE
jgi:beta-glucosidase